MSTNPFVPAKTQEEIQNRKRILIYCPVGSRLEPEVESAVLHQTYDGYCDVMFARDNPHKRLADVLQNIQLAYEKMKTIVLNEGYDKVWIVEADTIPPLDALEKLVEVSVTHQIPVVGGLYALRHGAPATNLCDVHPMGGETGLGWPWAKVKAAWGKIVQVGGACMGCLLVDREVLKGFSFITGERFAPDKPFADYCCKNKIRTAAHLGVVCGHKKPNGDVIWPDVNARIGYRIDKKAA